MKPNNTRLLLSLFGIFLVLTISGCATVIPVEECVADLPFGFWFGLLHGFISPFTFIIGLFRDDIAIYAVNNNGNWYNFGFILGAMIIFGGSGNRAR